jgi:uncharacterized protein YtpQ (UPF0354 family)
MKLKKWMKRTKKATATFTFATTNDAVKANEWLSKGLVEAVRAGEIDGIVIKQKHNKVKIVCDGNEVRKFWEYVFEV